MDDLPGKLQKTLDDGQQLLMRASNRWDRGVNRRTAFFLVALAALMAIVYYAFVRPPGAFPTGELVTIERGATLAEAADALENQNVIRSPELFKLFIRVTGGEGDVHAGDYMFKEPRSVFSIARAVVRGAYGLEPQRFRVAEGAMTKDMAVIFSDLKRFDEERFLANAKPLEGYLFPDTYFFLPNATDELVIETMRQNFDTQLEVIQEHIDAFGKPLADVIIMASLLEREARLMEDRRMIAGVLWNRLDRDMLLQVDAAFLYTLGKGSFDLTVDDLTSDSPYNTYRYKGLPPTPIGSPSLDSILAAVTPIEHNYLFYLADNTGVTHYSRTYEEHLRLKRQYLGP